MEKGLSIVGLEIENVKRLKAIQIHPSAVGVVKICGANAAGKSSVLDAIEAALSSKRAEPEVPIRTGEKKAKIVLDLGEFRVIRTWSPKDSYLTVERKDGKVAKPREFLDRLIGSGLGFDPLSFAKQESVIQVSTMLDLLKLPEDPRQLDEQKAELTAQRRDVNRQVKQLQGHLAGLPKPDPKLPRDPVSLEELLQEHARLRNLQREDEAQEQAIKSAKDELDRADAEIERIVLQLEEARGQRVAAGDKLAQLQDIAPHRVEQALAGLEVRIRGAESLNTQIRQARAYDEVAETALMKELEANGLTEQIEELEARKLDILASAKFPVPGLGFGLINGEYRVTFNGIPLAECASSERLRVGMAIAMATNPTVRVILIREGSLLDGASLAAIQEIASHNAYQVWLELVSEGDGDGGFVLVDGGLVDAGKAPTA